MKHILWKMMVASFLVLSIVSNNVVLADDDDDEGHEKSGWNIFNNDHDDDDHDWKKREKYKSKYLPVVDHPAYIKECGACHFTFQPGLLPSGSWEKIMADLSNHFGDDASLKEETKVDILTYLRAGAAENSSAKRSVKIMRSLGDQTPLRITETPYIIRKHDELSDRIIKRKSIKTLSNCLACHTSAKRGIYSERYIHIPQ